jgi:hypothetical protein
MQITGICHAGLGKQNTLYSTKELSTAYFFAYLVSVKRAGKNGLAKVGKPAD